MEKKGSWGIGTMWLQKGGDSRGKSVQATEYKLFSTSGVCEEGNVGKETLLCVPGVWIG